MKCLRLSRRALLRGAGGVAIGLPFLGVMAPQGRALAANMAPKRYINFFSPNGTIYSAWAPTAGASPTDFKLSRILAPLTPNQKNIVVLDGLSNVAGTHGPGDDHMRGMGTMLTGTELLPGTNVNAGQPGAGLAGGISVDQVVAQNIGKKTKISSLELGIESGSAGTVWGYTSYTGPSQPLPPDNDPGSVFKRAFSDLGTSTSSAGQKLAAERKSILDAVIANYTQLDSKLGAEDRAKLDAHLSTVRDLETRVTAAGPALSSACVKPAAPAGDHQKNASFPTVAKLQMDLLVMAMACDVTRVASLQFEMSVGSTQFTWVDPAITRGHHDMSHDADSNADTKEKLTKINVWYAEQFNYLINALAAVPEPKADGSMGTMLDNTVIVWCNELAKGNVHSHSPQPFVLAGGAGGALQTGRLMHYDKISHNNLCVSLINMMGGNATTFGNPAYCSGPLSGL